MKKSIFSLFFFSFSVFSLFALNETTKNFQLSLITPLGTNGTQSHSIINKASLNILGGYSYGNTIFEFGGLYNINTHLTKGVQFAGLTNYSGQTENAIQIAGIANLSKSGTVTTQFSGVVNYAAIIHGTQISGVAGITNKINGAQIGGIFNITKKITGVQIAGVTNIASDVTGFQLAGILNMAKKIKGVQLGLINFAEESDGVSLGLINIIKKNGKQEFEVAFSEALNTSVSFKLGTNKFYTIFSGGINYSDKPLQYAAGLGLGSQINWKKGWCNQIEVMGYALTENKSFKLDGINMLTQIKLPVSYNFTQRFNIFAGPTLNMTISEYLNPENGILGSSLSPYSIWKNKSDKIRLNGWIGFSAGVRF